MRLCRSSGCAKRGSAVAARRRQFVRRASKRRQDLVWVTTVVAASLLESTPTDIGLLVIPSDWAVTAGFEHCTLMGIRGWLSWTQEAAATAADATGTYMAIYVTDQAVAANSMDPTTATEYSDFDILWTDGGSLNTGAGTGQPFPARQLEIKTRRRLTSVQSVRLAAAVDGDTATPRVGYNGVIRSLLKVA